MDFNDIFKFDEITNDNDVNTNDLDEKYKKNLISDNSLININDNKIIENSTEKLISQQKEQYDFDNTNNMILDLSEIPLNPVINSISKRSYDNSITSNPLIDTTNKKMQNIFDTEILKNTELNDLYPQLYSNNEYPMEEEQDTFTQYMNYPNTNIDINNNPYLPYYNNAFNQDEIIPPYNSADFINYNNEFDFNGINSYYPFPSDMDIEDIDIENYTLASSHASDEKYKQALTLIQENELNNTLSVSSLNKSNFFENKKQKDLNSLNSLPTNPLTTLPLNKSINIPKLSFSSNSLIIPSNEENNSMIEDTFKYIYPMNPKNKLLYGIKNDLSFENLVSLDSLSQQMNLSDNTIKKSILNEKLDSLKNIDNDNLNINKNDITQELNQNTNDLFQSSLSKLKIKSQLQSQIEPTNSNSNIESSKINPLNKIKDMNDLMEFDFSSLDNALNENLIKIKPNSVNNKNIENTPLIPDEISSLLFPTTETIPEATENDKLDDYTEVSSIEDYKNILNPINSQNKDYNSEEEFLKMFIPSPKLTNTNKDIIKSVKDQLIEEDISSKILIDKPVVNSPLISEFINEPKDQTKELLPISDISKLSFSSLAKNSSSTTIPEKIDKPKLATMKSHPLLNNIINNPIQKKTSSLLSSKNKNKNNLLSKEISNDINNILPNTLLSSISNVTSTSSSISSTKSISTKSISNSIKNSSPVSSPSLPKSLITPALDTSASLFDNKNTSHSLSSTFSSIPTLSSFNSLPLFSIAPTTSGSGKEHLLKQISITSATSNSSVLTSTLSSSSPISTSSKKSTIKSQKSTPILSTKPSPKPSPKTSLISSTKSLSSSSSPSASTIPITKNTINSNKISTSSTSSTSTPSSSTTATTLNTSAAAKIVPKPIAPLTSLPLTTTIPSLSISTTLNNKPNLNVPSILPSSLFPFLFTDSANLISTASTKSIAEKLKSSSLPGLSTTVTNKNSISNLSSSSEVPSSSVSTTASPVSSSTSIPIPVATTISSLNIKTTSTPTKNIPSTHTTLSSLSLSNSSPIVTSTTSPSSVDSNLSKSHSSESMSTSIQTSTSKSKIKNKQENNIKANSLTPTTTPSISPLTTVSNNASTISSTTSNTTDSKTNKNLSKNSNNYIDEKRRKFLERNRIAGKYFNLKKK